jgi:cytochrome c peroxidase
MDVPEPARLSACSKVHHPGTARPDEVSGAERRGEALVFGKAQCAACHVSPYLHDDQLLTLDDTL